MVSRFKDVMALKHATENLNTQKSTIIWVRVFENWGNGNGLKKDPEIVRPEQALFFFFFMPAYVNKTKPTTIVSVVCHS